MDWIADEAELTADETVADAPEAADERDWEAAAATDEVALLVSFISELRCQVAHEARAEVPEATSEEASETAPEAPSEREEAAELSSAISLIP
jgi:glutamate/tyrosine decarboxylase-like PLP-dependent enzyme